MGRKKAFDQEEALRLARNLFWEKGYERTSLTDLLSAMGLHKKSFYDTFISKKALFIDALRSYHHLVKQQMVAAIAGADTGAEKIRRLFTASLQGSQAEQRGCMIVHTIADNFESDPAVRALVLGWEDEVKAMFLQLLQEDQAKGRLAAEADMSLMAERIYNAYLGFRLQLKFHRHAEGMERLLDAILNPGPPLAAH